MFVISSQPACSATNSPHSLPRQGCVSASVCWFVCKQDYAYRKTSNKRPRRLYEQSANTPRCLMETRRVLEVLRYIQKVMNLFFLNWFTRGHETIK